MRDKTLGDMIQHDFMGQFGMQTGTLANTLALERRDRQLTAAREAMRLSKIRPATPPPPVFPFSAKLAGPLVGDPPKFPLEHKKPARRTIPAWKWYLAGCLTGLILPWFF